MANVYGRRFAFFLHTIPGYTPKMMGRLALNEARGCLKAVWSVHFASCEPGRWLSLSVHIVIVK